jgi:LemA protein
MVMAVAAVFAVSYVIGLYNRLIEIKNNVDKSWGNIEVLEKQRYDEIPNLVKVCEGYMKYERDTLDKIVSARTKFMEAKTPSQVAAADGNLAGALKTLFAVSENYPELKADKSFAQLQGRVSAIESQIADRREFYNDSVNIYNIRISQVPYLFLANSMGWRPREMFKVSEGEKRSPEIKFNI